jgi:galactokinase
MRELDLRQRKKLRRLDSLANIRRELATLYHEAKAAELDPVMIQKYRALCFILNALADILRDEKMEGEYEARLERLEEAVKAGGKIDDFRIQLKA